MSKLDTQNHYLQAMNIILKHVRGAWPRTSERVQMAEEITALISTEVAKAKIEGKIRELRLNVVIGYIPDKVASVRRVILEAELAEVESNGA